MGEHEAIPTGTPTQVAHSGKAVIRTVVQNFVPTLILLSVAIPLVVQYLGPYLPESWVAWLSGAVVFLLALVALITKIMALPQLQPFLAKVGLGTGVEKEPARIAASPNDIEGDVLE